MFWLTVMFILLIFLLILLVLRLREDKRVKIARDEMPGKVVVVTSANSLLGEALARAFYTAGCKLVLTGPNQAELERVRSQLFSMRPKDIPVYQPEVAVMEASEVEIVAHEKVAEMMESCGQVDILINNSTISTRSDILSTSVDDDIRVMNINYFAPIALTKAMLPFMIQRKSGKVVFVSSVAGKVPIPYRSSFAASKHALQAFSDSLRAEMAMHNVSVLVSNPEYISSDMTRDELQTAGTEKEVLEIGKTSSGESPLELADEILMSVLRDDNEQMRFSFKIANWLRNTCPPFFHFMMAARAKRMFDAIAADPQRF